MANTYQGQFPFHWSTTLFLEAKDLRSQPLSAKRESLPDLLKKPPESIRLSEDVRMLLHFMEWMP
jgi:hypothetical protein